MLHKLAQLQSLPAGDSGGVNAGLPPREIVTGVPLCVPGEIRGSPLRTGATGRHYIPVGFDSLDYVTHIRTGRQI